MCKKVGLPFLSLPVILILSHILFHLIQDHRNSFVCFFDLCNRHQTNMLLFMTTLTQHPQVIFLIITTTTLRNNMVYSQTITHTTYRTSILLHRDTSFSKTTANASPINFLIIRELIGGFNPNLLCSLSLTTILSSKSFNTSRKRLTDTTIQFGHDEQLSVILTRSQCFINPSS
jgi:hypothetical protein